MNITNTAKAIVLGTGLILLAPLIAMQFTDEVDWTLGDFVVASALLLGTGLMFELCARKLKGGHRIVLALVLLFLLALVWADLAVGIFNIPGFSGS